MTDSSFKDLVIDAGDAVAAAEFWAAALGLSVEPTDTGPNTALLGERPEQTIWINQVPEPKTVKQRVHLDVHAAGTAELLALGAVLETEHAGWTVLRDPEGGEFCAFLRDPVRLPRYRLYELVVDSADPERISNWWAERFGTDAEHDPSDPWYWLPAGRAGLPWEMIFHPVPEPKTVKNRLHWDVWGDTGEFIAAGARLLRGRDGENGGRDGEIGWDVLADPEGNEFCVFTR